MCMAPLPCCWEGLCGVAGQAGRPRRLLRGRRCVPQGRARGRSGSSQRARAAAWGLRASYTRGLQAPGPQEECGDRGESQAQGRPGQADAGSPGNRTSRARDGVRLRKVGGGKRGPRDRTRRGGAEGRELCPEEGVRLGTATATEDRDLGPGLSDPRPVSTRSRCSINVRGSTRRGAQQGSEASISHSCWSWGQGEPAGVEPPGLCPDEVGGGGEMGWGHCWRGGVSAGPSGAMVWCRGWALEPSRAGFGRAGVQHLGCGARKRQSAGSRRARVL